MNKLVSIACRVYNSEKYIEKAIKSVLSQTYTNWELVIVDDNSTDKSQDIIKSFKDDRIKYYRNNTNIGIIANLNKVLSLCEGEYISILDGDDYYAPNKLEIQVDFLDKNPDYGAVFSYVDFSYEKTYYKSKIILEKLINNPSGTREEMLLKIFNKENFLAFPTEMFRKQFLINFPDSIIATGDCNFHIHILFHSKIKVLEMPLVTYTIAGSKNTSTWFTKDIMSCENIYLLNHFAKMYDLELFKAIFNGYYEKYGNPTTPKDIPYFISRLALDTPIRHFSGLYLLQTLFEDNNYFTYIMQKFNLSYKDYIDLRCSSFENTTKTKKKKIFGITYMKEKETNNVKKITYFYIVKKYNYKDKIQYSLLGIKFKPIFRKNSDNLP
ncbi:glycosyltransferase family 2 protein [Campylobacter lanienae]|uniref:glycosyltransferase family 2 protein n=1 Tax=Campylobacter lanienae TaxID=75658 RepID=UPI000BB43AE7|nr:glycosyltransferase family 2 protein [Campylobacter lanienae]